MGRRTTAIFMEYYFTATFMVIYLVPLNQQFLYIYNLILGNSFYDAY